MRRQWDTFGDGFKLWGGLNLAMESKDVHPFRKINVNTKKIVPVFVRDFN